MDELLPQVTISSVAVTLNIFGSSLDVASREFAVGVFCVCSDTTAELFEFGISLFLKECAKKQKNNANIAAKSVIIRKNASLFVHTNHYICPK